MAFLCILSLKVERGTKKSFGKRSSYSETTTEANSTYKNILKARKNSDT